MAGLVANISSRVRHFMRRDKENMVVSAAQGSTASTLPASTYDLLQNYGYDIIADYLRVEQDLMTRFIDYEGMDDYPETSATLNIYADDSTQPDTPTNRRVWVESPDRDIEVLLNDFLHRTLRIEDELWSMSRSLCKFGNDYEEIIVGQDGVIGINHLPAHTVRRVEGPRGETYGFVQDFKRRLGYNPREFQELLARRLKNMQQGGLDSIAPNEFRQPANVTELEAVPFENWQVVHMRLRSKHRKSIYGYSVYEPARWIWKRLVLLEDAALIYRLQRAAERYAFYVDTGSRPPNEAIRLLNFVRHQFKKKKFVNPTTGELDLKFNTLAQDEDFFIPVVDGKESTRVEVLGSPNWQHMEDIEYFKNKMFAAMLVPKAYLSQEEGINRAVLSSEDVRFARTILRVQREMKHGLEKICRVHLAALEIPPGAVDFDVRFTVPSAIFELAQMEVRNARADLASRMREHVSQRWVLENVFSLPEHEIKRIFLEREEDQVRDGRSMGKAEKAQQMAGGGQQEIGGGGGFGGGGMGGGGLRAHRNLPMSRLILNNRGAMSERELLEGDRESKRVSMDINRILKQHSAFGRQLREVRGLLTDMRALMPKR